MNCEGFLVLCAMEAPRRVRSEQVPYRRRPPSPDEECVAKKRLKSHPASAKFLLPNGASVALDLQKERWMDFDGFFEALEKKSSSSNSSSSRCRMVDWRSQNLWLEDLNGEKIDDFELLFSGSDVFLVQDGKEPTVHGDQALWNVTPEPEMLERLPDGYNLETALADHLDNALQAVWDNPKKNRRLVSVEIQADEIIIFDTGHGMDGSSENCVAKWGTVGASRRRELKHLGVGGPPPFLAPYLGKYGLGGVSAALFLGKRVEVRSKTAKSSKVVTLSLKKEELINNQRKEQGGDRFWRTGGRVDSVTEDERKKSPHGSFTSVKISGLNSQACLKGKQQYWKLKKLRQMLKDIYALYIQADRAAGSSAGTVTSVEFQVNGKNLLGELGGEITTCNKHSCHGDPFVVDFKFSSGSEIAHGRLTCQYFPNIRGRETLQQVIDELEDGRSFDSFPRVAVRWLGRLLPSARCHKMPFMEVTGKEKDQLRWVKRVKIFADLDGGFQPTPTKTNLVAFTSALKQLGATVKEDPEVQVNIQRNGKILSNSELSNQFAQWVKAMHENYDRNVSAPRMTWNLAKDLWWG